MCEAATTTCKVGSAGPRAVDGLLRCCGAEDKLGDHRHVPLLLHLRGASKRCIGGKEDK